MLRHVIAPTAALLLAACNPSPAPGPAASSSSPPPSAPASAAPSAAASAPAAAPAEHLAVDWDVPSAWEPLAAPALDRSVVYRIKPAAGDTDPAEVAVRAGGSVEAIVARWQAWAKAPHGGPQRLERTVKGMPVVLVEIHGEGGVLGAIVMTKARAAAEADLAKAQAELDRQREKLTDQHPDVKALTARVDGMRAKLAADDEEGGGPLVIEVRGPDKTVRAAKDDFGRVVESLRPR